MHTGVAVYGVSATGFLRWAVISFWYIFWVVKDFFGLTVPLSFFSV